MTKYVNVNVKLSNLQLEKKISRKYETELNLVGNVEASFPHKLLLTDRYIANIHVILKSFVC